MAKKPLVKGKYLLQKYPGKGGWTYAAVNVSQNTKNPFGWTRVKGRIDDYELKQYNLAPMGNGKLFLPVKAEIRKKISKKEGDYVHVVLYLDDSRLEIPDEIMECFRLEPKNTYQTFLRFTDSERKAYLDWIYAAKKEDTKATRILEMMTRLQKKLKLHDPDDPQFPRV